MVTVSARKTGRPKNELLTARRREEILHAAAHIFAERGYPNTDLQAVADTLQIGKGTIYRYFPSKRDLFLAAVYQGMHQLQELIDTTLSGIEDPFEKIVVGLRTYLAYFKPPNCSSRNGPLSGTAKNQRISNIATRWPTRGKSSSKT
ncbi:MAG TPA: TetR/AcrR family transcriptional regulator [bacterium]|mgnify:FL=1|nr:TetR/AcrR family transcriptional regulator [bacterium]